MRMSTMPTLVIVGIFLRSFFEKEVAILHGHSRDLFELQGVRFSVAKPEIPTIRVHHTGVARGPVSETQLLAMSPQ